MAGLRVVGGRVLVVAIVALSLFLVVEFWPLSRSDTLLQAKNRNNGEDGKPGGTSVRYPNLVQTALLDLEMAAVPPKKQKPTDNRAGGFVHVYTVPPHEFAMPSEVTGLVIHCGANCTRDEQIRLGFSRFVPLFLKFHKVGSGTVADAFRRHCGAVSRRVGAADGDHYPWRPRPGVFCGKTPHEHGSMSM